MTKKYRVTLTLEERTTLLALIQTGKAAARTLTHARILLKVAEAEGGPAYPGAAVCEALHVGLATVARVRQAFVEAGLDVALHQRRALRPRARKLDGEQEAHLIALVCGAPPTGRARWTLRLLADELVRLELVDEISHETVRQTLKKMNSSPG